MPLYMMTGMLHHPMTCRQVALLLELCWLLVPLHVLVC
jgi:hypothetical protein